MKKILISIAICFIGIMSVFCFSGCGGESAYDIAVRNGYQGTESQWLESLKGDDGNDGIDGVDYEDIKKIYKDLTDSGQYSGTFLQFVKDYLNVYVSKSEVIASNCLLSTVSVSAYYTVNEKDYVSYGSGVIYDIDEANNVVYVVTNYHVVYVYQNAEVTDNLFINLYGSEDFDSKIACSFLGGSEKYDLAVLKIEGAEAQRVIGSNAKEVELADLNELNEGESILAVGNPEGNGLSVVSGIVSKDSEYISYSISSTVYHHRVFRVDAPINGGNSGGGVYNSDGYLIGIANAKFKSTYSYGELNVVEGMSYGIPITNVISVADYVIKYCDGGEKTTVKAYQFGITISGANGGTKIVDGVAVKTEDVAIHALSSNFLAEKIGLQKDDIFKVITINKTNGKVISMEIIRDFMVGDVLKFLEVGDSVAFQILRGGETTTITYTIQPIDADFQKTVEKF